MSSKNAMWWMLCVGFMAMSINSMMKHLSHEFHPFQLMFFYCAPGTLLLLPFYLRSRNAQRLTECDVRVRRLYGRLHVLRAIFEFSGFSLSFYAISHLPLPTQTSISFLSPIFASLFAVWWLKEHMNRRKIIALLLGMVGVLIISDPLSPHGAYIPILAVVATLTAALLFGACGVLIRRLTYGESAIAIAFKMMALTTLITLPFAFSVWKPVAADALLWLAPIATLSAMVQYAVANALQQGSVTSVVPLTYVNLIWSALFAYLFFGEVIEARTMVGAAFIIGAALMTTMRKPLNVSNAQHPN